jgi:hypothetical protein
MRPHLNQKLDVEVHICRLDNGGKGEVGGLRFGQKESLCLSQSSSSRAPASQCKGPSSNPSTAKKKINV